MAKKAKPVAKKTPVKIASANPAATKAQPATREQYETWKKEKDKKVNAILDSAYPKLLSPDVTQEMQEMLNVSSSVIGSLSAKTQEIIEVLESSFSIVGGLSVKLVEDFLNGKDINTKQCRKILKILDVFEGSSNFDYFDEYADKGVIGIRCHSIGYLIRIYIVNMAIRKLKQENPKLGELLQILDELDIER
ncbi:MAG: hypothetical protein FWC26_15495 [Fibromonadales bacterium]|nr:hypothetical protein [Fibromonadales bacterium]